MNTRKVSVIIILIAVSSVVGWNRFLALASNGANKLAIIEDFNGDHIAVEPTSDDIWNQLVELYQSGEELWIGGQIEIFLTFIPDPNYPWGFRFEPDTITLAEVTAEGLQSTLTEISENLDYWLDIRYSYVFAKVIKIQNSN